MRTRKRPDSLLTINLVDGDLLRRERVRAVFSATPFQLLITDQPRFHDADLVVLPARRTGPAQRDAAGIPVIAYGPADLMRSAFLWGCTDYLRDPWTPQELLLRSEVALRRAAACYEFPWGTVHVEGGALCTPRGAAPLTRQQAVILRALLRCRGEPVPRASLACLLGSKTRTGSRAVDVQVSVIRRRLRELVPETGGLIRCVRGHGYVVP